MRKLQKDAFTLIELLVVIAIISLLVTILMPSLQKAKQLARNTMCCTNLSGLGKAMYQYLQEFEGTHPMLTQWEAVDDHGKPTQEGAWFRDLAKMMGYSKVWTTFPCPPGEEETWENPGLFLCPLTDRTVVTQGTHVGDPGWATKIRKIPRWPEEPRPAGSWWEELLSYGYNGAFGWSDADYKDNDRSEWVQAGSVIRSHEKVLIGDSDNRTDRDWYVGGSFADEAGLGFRHNGGANIVFHDGHVGWEDPYHLQSTWALGTGFTYAGGLEGQRLFAKYWAPGGR